MESGIGDRDDEMAAAAAFTLFVVGIKNLVSDDTPVLSGLASLELLRLLIWEDGLEIKWV